MSPLGAALFLAAKKDSENEARRLGVNLPEEDTREFLRELHEELKCQDRCHGCEVKQDYIEL